MDGQLAFAVVVGHADFAAQRLLEAFLDVYKRQACYPYLAESHGSVINFASGAGLFGNFGQSAYADVYKRQWTQWSAAPTT